MSRPREALSGAVAVVLSAARLGDEHDIKYPAAALAYYGFVSVLPLLVVVLAVVGDTVAGAVYAGTLQLLAPEPRRLVAESLRTATGRTGASVLALVAFSWCGVNVAADFLTVVGRVEGAPRRPRTTRVRDALAVLSSLAVAVALVVLTGGVFAQLPADSSLLLGWPVALVVALIVAFLPLYYVPSRTSLSLRRRSCSGSSSTRCTPTARRCSRPGSGDPAGRCRSGDERRSALPSRKSSGPFYHPPGATGER
jgi:membrane protein